MRIVGCDGAIGRAKTTTGISDDHMLSITMVPILQPHRDHLHLPKMMLEIGEHWTLMTRHAWWLAVLEPDRVECGMVVCGEGPRDAEGSLEPQVLHVAPSSFCLVYFACVCHIPVSVSGACTDLRALVSWVQHANTINHGNVVLDRIIHNKLILIWPWMVRYRKLFYQRFESLREH